MQTGSHSKERSPRDDRIAQPEPSHTPDGSHGKGAATTRQGRMARTRATSQIGSHATTSSHKRSGSHNTTLSHSPTGSHSKAGSHNRTGSQGNTHSGARSHAVKGSSGINSRRSSVRPARKAARKAISGAPLQLRSLNLPRTQSFQGLSGAKGRPAVTTMRAELRLRPPT